MSNPRNTNFASDNVKHLEDVAYRIPSSPKKTKLLLTVNTTPGLKAKADKDNKKSEIERKRKIDVISNASVSMDGICIHQMEGGKKAHQFQCSSVSDQDMQKYNEMLTEARKESKIAADTMVTSQF